MKAAGQRTRESTENVSTTANQYNTIMRLMQYIQWVDNTYSTTQNHAEDILVPNQNKQETNNQKSI